MLHVHSYYSFLRGLASPEALVEAAAGLGWAGLALTDRDYLTGAIPFYDAARAAGLQPLLGLEVCVQSPQGQGASPGAQHPLLLLAEDFTGWGSLCRLSSRLNAAAGETAPSLRFDQLAAETAGLLCLTGGRAGLAAETLRRGEGGRALHWLSSLADLFPGRLYAELQQHAPADRSWVSGLARLAGELRLPLVATHTIDYLAAGQAGLQRLVSAIRLNTPLARLPADAAAPPEAIPLSPAALAQRFEEYPQAIAAIDEIFQRCRVELPLGKPQFPTLDLPPGETIAAALRRRAENGAARLYPNSAGELPGEVRQRLEHELAVIEQCGYSSLFIIVADILAHARRAGTPISSRGSAAGSLVAHCLDITSPDPLRLNLYFERFLNPARATPPDIDTDLCSRRRDGVIQHVFESYGAERVAMVCTINRFRQRSALREVAKAYGLPQSEVSALADSLPHRWFGPPWRQKTGEAPYSGLAAQFRDETHQAIFRDAASLLGTPHHLSIHPGGIVIAPGNLTDLAPTSMAAKGVIITQFDLEAIERLGLVKIDLLGIRGLSVLGDVAEALSSAAAPGQPPPNPLEALEAIPQDDDETAALVRRGGTIGCFQIESPGMRLTLKEIQADSVDDIMAALALYRPGPLTGGLKDAFVRRYRGQEATTHLHPALAPLLADTYGVILYQEQVLRIAHELAGLSLADADLLRRAMSHFDPGKQMQTLKEKFLAGAWQRAKMPAATAERVWELMAAFAGYGFPKAHAASYAQVAWRAAWCKTHHPAMFMAAVLANWGGYYSQRVYLTEARRLGLTLHAPHINYAGTQFRVAPYEGRLDLFMGLDQVRELTQKTQARILRERPFTSLEDFLARADPRPVEAENLVRCGALENLGSGPAMLRRLKSGSWQAGQMALFGFDESPEDEWPLAEQAAAQEQVLGVSIAAHRLELAAAEIAASGAINTLEAAACIGHSVRVAGMRQTWRRFSSPGGDYNYSMGLEDLDGLLEVFIPGGVYRRARLELADSAGPFIIEGSVEFDAELGEALLRATRIQRLR